MPQIFSVIKHRTSRHCTEVCDLLDGRNHLLQQFNLHDWFDVTCQAQSATYGYFPTDVPSLVSSNSHALGISNLQHDLIRRSLNSLKAQVSCLLAAIETKTNVASVLASVLHDALVRTDVNDKGLDHRIQHLLCLAYTSQIHKDTVLSLRGEAAERVLFVMMDMVRTVADDLILALTLFYVYQMSSKRSLNAFHSRATAPYRLSLRRLFLHLSKVSRVIPSRLFLHDIICHEHDRIPCGEGQYAEVFRAKYNDVYVSLKRLRVYQNRHNGAEDHEV